MADGNEMPLAKYLDQQNVETSIAGTTVKPSRSEQHARELTDRIMAMRAGFQSSNHRCDDPVPARVALMILSGHF